MGAYLRPRRLEDALAALARPHTVLAGGTDFYPARVGRAIDEDVLDIGGIALLRGIAADASGWRLGATTTWSELIEADLPPLFDGLKQAGREVGGRQIQNAGTLAGNLCNASPAADGVPAMIAAGVTCVVVGSKGKREVPVEQIATGPGKTSLAKDELIVEFRFPKKAARTSDAYLRFIPRTEMDIAVVGCGINLTLDDKGVCTAARVVLGAVAPTAVVVPDAAKALIGSKLDDAALAKLDAAARAACKPIDDKRGTIDYRIKVAGVLARRTAAIAFERAGGAK
jgi:carbon-monoxide dehydrogenase medium subunit